MKAGCRYRPYSSPACVRGLRIDRPTPFGCRRQGAGADSAQGRGAAARAHAWQGGGGRREDHGIARTRARTRRLVGPRLPCDSCCSGLTLGQFDRYDTDKSGFIERHELSALCAKLGRELQPAQLDDAMRALDKDGSGHVGLDEFMWWWNLGLSVAALSDTAEVARLHQRAADGAAQLDAVSRQAPTPEEIEKTFHAHDRDASGGLGVRELGASLRELGLRTEGSAARVLRKYDELPDGQLDLAEFSALVLAIHEENLVTLGGAGKESAAARERHEMRMTDEMAGGTQLPSPRSATRTRRASLDGGASKDSPGFRSGRRGSSSGTKDAPEREISRARSTGTLVRRGSSDGAGPSSAAAPAVATAPWPGLTASAPPSTTTSKSAAMSRLQAAATVATAANKFKAAGTTYI